MIIVSSSQTKKVQVSATTAVWEFPMDEQALSGAVAEVKGRYPKQGFAVNKKSKELVFVISGSGHVITLNRTQPIQVGDLVFLDKGESFAWEAKPGTKESLTIFMATTPAFNPKQHIIAKSDKIEL